MKNLQAGLSRLSTLPPRVRSAVQSAEAAAARSALEHARRVVPVRTGALRASLTADSVPHAAVTARRYYAGFVERKKPYLTPAQQQADFPGKLERTLKEALK